MADTTNTRLIAKHIEEKQYKKAIKASDAILKKQPEHGETLCMKGLTYSYLDRKEEAYDLVRRGLKNDIRSHVCWHVFGLLYRQDSDYLEAVKCYRHALRYDADNVQIHRDLSLLQIHRRDLQGFCETRKKLLQQKSGNKINWIGYAVAEHLCKNYSGTLTVLDSYDKTVRDEQVSPYDRSETLMYKATVLKEAERYEEALACLVKNEDVIVDKLGRLEQMGQLMIYLNKLDDGLELFESLLEMNSENHFYVLSLMACEEKFRGFWTFEGAKNSFPTSVFALGTPVNGWLSTYKAPRVQVRKNMVKRPNNVYEPLRPLTEEEEDHLSEFFDRYLEQYPKSDSLCRIPLFFLNASTQFEQRIDKYLKSRLRKGVPSLFRMIRGLYQSEGKVEILERLTLLYVKNLEERQVFEEGTEIEPPTSLLFTYMLIAQHYDILGDYDAALSFAEKARVHTPTLVEIYSLKGRILKHAGALRESFEEHETGRIMDTADRFLNTESTKACFAINDTRRGDEIVLLFSKENESSTTANLHDMQCMWYECHVGRALHRKQQFGLALKKFHETFKHFNDIAEDQFDFHNYCLRKSTLRTYIQMLRVQDRLFSHKFYRRAAKDSLNIYFDLYDRRQRGEAVSAVDQEKEMTVLQRRKEKHRKKKQAAKEQKQVESKPPAGSKKKPEDLDPQGEKLLEADPLEEALKIVRILVNSSGLWQHTHVLAFECFQRLRKPLLCLRSLLRLRKLGKSPYYYKLLPLTAQFFLSLTEGFAEDSAYSDLTQKLILELSPPLFDHEGEFADFAAVRKAAEVLFDNVEKRQTESLSNMLVETVANLRCLDAVGRNVHEYAVNWLKAPSRTMGTLKDFQKSAQYFQKFGCGEKFASRARELFNRADVFLSTEEPNASSA